MIVRTAKLHRANAVLALVEAKEQSREQIWAIP